MRYRVTVGGITKYQTEVEASSALHAATKAGTGTVTLLDKDLYTDSLGRVIRVELIADGADDPLPRRDEEDGK